MYSDSSTIGWEPYNNDVAGEAVSSTPTPSVSARTPSPNGATIGGVTYKVANCLEDRKAAFQLVYDAYLQSGLAEPNPDRMRITPFHLLPTTTIFNATHQNRLIYTMSLISDGDMGLPLDTTYEHEVRQLRKQGRLAEVSCLASRNLHFPRSRMFDVFVQLVGLMFQFARENNVKQLVIVCHPRHVRFYQRFLGFAQFGEQKPYSSVRDNPAIACSHHFEQLDQSHYRLYDQVYGYPFQSWELRPQPMSSEETSYFEERIGYVNAECAPLV